MLEALLAVVVVAGLVVLVVATQRRRVRLLALDRLAETGDGTPPADSLSTARPALPLRRRRWLPWAVAAATLILVVVALRWNLIIGVGVAGLAGIVASMIERVRVDRLTGRLESQLADAIDIISAGIRAGSSLLTAIEGAAEEIDAPLSPVLARVAERLRLGESPVRAFARLRRTVPIETVQMFSLSVAVNLEAGGALGPVLEGVAKTVRQRLEVAQRIRAQSIQSQLSVLAIMAITYFIAFAMWWINPERTTGFLASGVGGRLIGAAILLQALGLSRGQRPPRGGEFLHGGDRRRIACDKA